MQGPVSSGNGLRGTYLPGGLEAPAAYLAHLGARHGRKRQRLLFLSLSPGRAPRDPRRLRDHPGFSRPAEGERPRRMGGIRLLPTPRLHAWRGSAAQHPRLRLYPRHGALSSHEKARPFTSEGEDRSSAARGDRQTDPVAFPV